MIKKYCKGSKTNGRKVIEELEKLGGKNSSYLNGKSETALYYININNVIKSAYDYDLQQIILENYEEIIVPEKNLNEEAFKINSYSDLKQSLDNYYHKTYKVFPFNKVYAEINETPVHLNEVQVRYIQYLCSITKDFEEFKEHYVIYSGEEKETSHKMIFSKSGRFLNEFDKGFEYDVNNNLAFEIM